MVRCIISRSSRFPARIPLWLLYLAGMVLLLSCSFVKGVIFPYTPTPTATPSLTPTPSATATASATPSPLPSPTPSPLPSATPTPLSTEAALLAQANARNKQLQTVRVDLALNIRSGGQKLQVSGTMLQEKPAKSYTKLNNAGTGVEVYALDEKTIYQRKQGEAWTRLGPVEIARYQGLQGTRETELLDLARNIFQVEDGEVGGVPCLHLLFELDMPAYQALYQPQYRGAVDPKTMNGVGEAWIGKADGYIYRVITRIEMEMQGEQVTTVTDLRLSSFNQPLAFPPTPAAP